MRSATIIWGCSLALAGLSFALMQLAFASEHNVLRVSFLDVGQGDSILIESPAGAQLLIDGGAGRAALEEIGEALPWWDRSLDMVIATHPDADHIGGLPDILERYEVGVVMRSSVEDPGGSDEIALERAIGEAQGRGTTLVTATRGQVISLGGGAYLEVLFPDRAVPRVETNTGSIVVRLVYGHTAFLLSGDSPQGVEEYLVRLDGASLDSDVLKAGHHGSRTSSSPLFVGMVSPTFAVFSRGCGNSYGHPHEEVVSLFASLGIATADTCTEGTVMFVSDGEQVRRAP